MKLAKGCTTKPQARVALHDAEKRIRDGLPGVPEQPAVAVALGLTWAALGQKFTTQYASPRLKAPADYRKEAASVFKQRITPALGERVAAGITSLDVERLRDWVVAPEPQGLGLSKASA